MRSDHPIPWTLLHPARLLLLALALSFGCNEPFEPHAPLLHAQGARADMTLDFRVDVTGTARGEQDADAMTFDLAGNVGTVAWQKEQFDLVVYLRTPPLAGYEVLQGLAVSAQRWMPIWFYCLDGSLDFVFYETTDGVPMEGIPAEGSCSLVAERHDVAVALPSSSFTPLYAAETRLLADGPQLTIPRSGPGTIELYGHAFTFHPIGFVDCTSCVADYPWYEVHGLVEDPDHHELTFTILYAFPGAPGPMQSLYGLTLPSLTTHGSVSLDTSWTLDGAGEMPLTRAHQRELPARPRPPR